MRADMNIPKLLMQPQWNEMAIAKKNLSGSHLNAKVPIDIGTP